MATTTRRNALRRSTAPVSGHGVSGHGVTGDGITGPGIAGHGTATALAALLIFAAAGALPARAQPAAPQGDAPAAPMSPGAPANFAPAELPPPVAPPVAALPPPVAPPVAALPPPAAAPAGSGEAAAEAPPMPKETEWVDTAPAAAPAAPATALLAPPPAAPAAAPTPAIAGGTPPAPQAPAPAFGAAPPPAAAPSYVMAPPPGAAGQPAAGGPPDLLHIANPVVKDTATLVADGKDIPLYGVGDGRGGDDAATLQKYINDSGARLDCRAENGSPQEVCTTPDGKDLGKVVLVNGLARVALGAPPAYANEEDNAQKSRRGLWADLPPAPERIDHPELPSTALVQAPQGTTIRLDGIEGITGAMASTLQTYIASNGDSIACQQQSPETHVCVLLKDDTDIAKLALVNGMAQTAADAPDEYVIEQDAAKVARRGIWANLPADAVAAAERDEAERRVLIATVNVADDGFTVVDGQPSMIVDGAPVFLVFAGLAGWGYWDHSQHWHGVPGDKAKRLDALHPHLRGWSNPSIRQAMASARPGDFGRGAPVSMSHAPGALAGGRGHDEAGRAGVVPASSRPIGGSGHPDVGGKDGKEAGREAGRETGRGDAAGREASRETGRGDAGARDAARAGNGRETPGREAPGREAPGREAGRGETGAHQEASARPLSPAVGGAHPGNGAPMRPAEPGLARPNGGIRPAAAPAITARPVAAPRPAMPAPRPAAPAPVRKK
jgi:endonuclease YncB( thermonuclease family)